MNLQSLPQESRPRERLVELGPSALSTIELLAILLGSGTKNRSVLQLSAELLAHFGSLDALADATLSELTQIRGVGRAKALQLQAVFALSKRVKTEDHTSLLVDTPLKAFSLLYPHFRDEKTEVLYVLLRDVRKNLLHKEEIGRGIINQLIVHPREVFYPAIRHKAHSLIIAHNHPSGDPSPSETDLEMTKQLHAASRLIGIQLVDHIIIGRDRFYSFYQQGGALAGY